MRSAWLAISVRKRVRALTSSRAGPCSVSTKARSEASGVRSSWLALAMKVGAHLREAILLGQIAESDQDVRRGRRRRRASRETVAARAVPPARARRDRRRCGPPTPSARSTATRRSGLRETWLIGWPLLILGNISAASRLWCTNVPAASSASAAVGIASTRRASPPDRIRDVCTRDRRVPEIASMMAVVERPASPWRAAARCSRRAPRSTFRRRDHEDREIDGGDDRHPARCPSPLRRARAAVTRLRPRPCAPFRAATHRGA